MNKPELLAPAGSMESLCAAVDNGADAVYFGVGSYNARSRADNFTIETIGEAILYCHCRGARAYLAANTLLKDAEITDAVFIIEKAYEAGIDAVIVQDIGLLAIIREKWPDLPIHASTQMNLFYSEAVKYAKESGISRIVLPRELSLQEIRQRQLASFEAGVEIEVFIHGAHCVSYSGVCLFSAMNASGTRSGNRGDCAQPCRNLYSISSESSRKLRGGRLLSIKDRTSVPVLEELMNMNVSSIKIEGRMRDASYVAVTVRAYRLLIDAIFEKRCDQVLKKKTTNALLQAYNRGGSFSSSFYSDGNNDDLYSGEYTSRYGIYFGKMIKTNSRTGNLTLEAESSNTLDVGDYLSIREGDSELASFPVGRIESTGEHINVFGLHPNTIEKLSMGLEVFISQKKSPLELLDVFTKTKTEISFALRVSEINAHELIAEILAPALLGQVVCATNIYTLPDVYSGSALTKDRVIEQIKKTKDTPFIVSRVEISKELNIFAPVSFINAIRRDMIERLEKVIATSTFRKGNEKNNVKPISSYNHSSNQSVMNGLSDKLRNIAIDYIDLRQFSGNVAHGADLYIISIYDLSYTDSIDKLHILFLEEPQAKILIRYPDAYSDKAAFVFERALNDFMEEFPNSIAGSISSKIYTHDDFKCFSPSANIMNSKALSEALRQKPLGLYLSSELSETDFITLLRISEELFSEEYLFIHRYGVIEWMQSEYCPLGRNAANCVLCRNKSMFDLQMMDDSDLKQNYPKPSLSLICRNDLCSSQILGPKKHIPGTATMMEINKLNIRTISIVRILDESNYEVDEIISGLSE